MKFIQLLFFVAAGMFILFDLAIAESAADRPPKGEPGQVELQPADREVWGDPEADEDEIDSPWTWFGMGYEMRNRRPSFDETAPDINNDASPAYGSKAGHNK